MRHYAFGRRSRPRRPKHTGNTVIHVPSTIGGTLAGNTSVVIIISSPSILAGGSASDNIEAQDKDRTVNVGHHIGRLNLSVNVRGTTATGILECCVYKVERSSITPVLGTFPVPSTAEILSQGIQQVCRLENPGKVFHTSKRAYSSTQTLVHNMVVSPAKYKLSKYKAGDHWILQLFNRGLTTINFDYEGRYKEYE